jgi:hypothetical protein
LHGIVKGHTWISIIDRQGHIERYARVNCFEIFNDGWGAWWIHQIIAMKLHDWVCWYASGRYLYCHPNPLINP